jgi:hypothetical protein
MGRPRKTLTKEQIKEIEKLAAVLNQTQIADYIGIPDRTLRAIMTRDDDVSAAYKRGRTKAIGSVAQALIQQAQAGNTTAMIFYLKTQAGWRENDISEDEDITPQKVQIEVVDARTR